jgi:cytochrome c-type biogenesis protein CcmF
MLAEFGYGVLVVTFLVSIYAIFASIFGQAKQSQKWIESSRLAMQLTFPLTTLAALTLIYLLVTDNYNVSFVYEVTSRTMPVYLKVTALWGGQAGSLLFWSWLLSLFMTAVTLRKWDRDRELLPWVVLVASITLAFFVGLAALRPPLSARRGRFPSPRKMEMALILCCATPAWLSTLPCFTWDSSPSSSPTPLRLPP